LYKLETLFKAAEAYFQEIMFLWFENHSVFTLKPSVIASLNGSTQTSKRSSAIMSKNKAGNSEQPNANASAAASQNPSQ